MATCNARTTIPNGEMVTPCDLEIGHNKREPHRGWCLGSRFRWSDNTTVPLDLTPGCDDGGGEF